MLFNASRSGSFQHDASAASVRKSRGKGKEQDGKERKGTQRKEKERKGKKRKESKKGVSESRKGGDASAGMSASVKMPRVMMSE